MILDLPLNGKDYLFDGDSMRIFEASKAVLENTKFELRRDNYLPYFRNLRINIFNNCNLACSYCYANSGSYNHPDDRIDLNDAKKAIDILAESVRNNNGNKSFIGFLGGEPLLSFKEIKYLVTYAKGKLKNVSFYTVTNGTLINREVLKYIIENNFYITVSLDGGKSTHDKHRKFKSGKGTFDTILKNIKELIEENKVQARITVTDECSDIEKMVREIHEKGIQKIAWAVDSKMANKNFKDYLCSSDKVKNYFYKCVKEKKYIQLNNYSELIHRLIQHAPKEFFCSSGSSTLAVSTDGKLYTCHRLIGNSDVLVGDINRINADKINDYCKSFFFKMTHRMQKECKNCFAYNFCGRGCYHAVIEEGGAVTDISERHCLYMKNTVKNVMELMVCMNVNQRAWYLRQFAKSINNTQEVLDTNL